jgi:DNA-binding NarL/FixJ family response regulator
MTGCTLIASKSVNLHEDIKKYFIDFGFSDVCITAKEKDGLSMLIRELKPRLLFIGCKFYECCTPFYVKDLHKEFPKLNIAAISIIDFPDELGMAFIKNGAKSYVNMSEGKNEFTNGLEMIKNGEQYISPGVQKCIAARSVNLVPSSDLTDRQLEVTRLICNGFTETEIADTLRICRKTVNKHKQELFTSLNVRNENELIRVAIYMGYINTNELSFYGRNYVIKPLPEKNKGLRLCA